MADVGGDALGGGAESAHGVGDAEVDLAGVGLGGDGVGGGEAGLLAEDLVELDDLVGVTVEQLEEGGLRAGGALSAAELKTLADGLDVLEVHYELLDPLAGALADGDELSGLVVGEAKGGGVLVLEGELLEVLDDLGQLGEDEIKSLLDKDQVGVIGDCYSKSVWFVPRKEPVICIP